MKKRHRIALRFLCTLCTVAWIVGSTAMDCGLGSIVCASVPDAGGAGMRISDVISIASDASETVPYVADAAMHELHGIVTYALGGDPNEGRESHQAGQNTKNNVAISLLWVRKSLKYARTVRFVLEPYTEKENVFELCAYVRRLLQSEEECIHTGYLYDRSAQKIYTADGTGMMGIGYDFNYSFDAFSASSDPWQRNFGFCRMYDCAAFLIGDVYETIRVPFRFGDKDWMIQVWKGIYSWNMLGGEIGLYNKPIEREAAFYDCATDQQRMPMAFSVALDDETIIQTEMSPSWWQTAFTRHKLASPRDLSMDFTLTFPNDRMLSAFLKSLHQAAPDLTIRQNDLTVHCFWSGD